MTDGTNPAVPELVPARMLNEFVYCPRLFYLEWVDGNWDENADTAQGRLAHRRSDTARGRLPEAESATDEDDFWEGAARSVTLDAPQLGIVAKIDLVEGKDGEVFPVDHKKGKPRSDGTPWEPELTRSPPRFSCCARTGMHATAATSVSGRRERAARWS